MRTLIVALFAALLVVGCSKDRNDKNTGDNQVSRSTQVPPGNTGRNDRDDATKTPGDQPENEADRKITQNVRKALTNDDSLSTDGKNVKVITSDRNVTLRGPVKSEKEKSEIENKAKQVTGVKKIDNQLEVSS
jgi:hyperosmotically inducible periplasmic protein